ncbi:MAG: efflux RND transporter permease subunit [Caldiserica bacterium]|nr:efflux RND transporter permease subunit [Caldisericota bacterium]
MGWEEGSNIGMLILDLVPKKERKRSSEEVANALRKKLSQIPGIEELTFETADPLETLILGGEKPVTVKIFGYDLEKTNLAAEKVKQMLKSIGGVTDIEISRKKGKPEIWIVVDRDKAAFSGSGTASIASQVRNLFHGKKSTKFREAGDEYDILIRMREKDRESLKDLMESPIRLLSGKTVPLKSLAHMEIHSGPSSIERESRERVIKVGGYLFKRKLSDVLSDLRVQLHNFTPPPGVTVKISGAVEEQAKAFRTLFFSLILGMILVYMVMASQFESFLHPLIIMFSVPFALTGVIWMLFLTGQTFNVDSLLGTVILIGIVVNNGIILVDYTNRLLRSGMELKEAVLKAGLRRVRPVLMTSLTTIFGLMPLALMRGEGSEEWNSLGLAAIGGLSLSTLVTLVLIPTLYYLAERRIQRLHGKG